MSKRKNAMEIREAFEEAGHSLSLFIDLCTSNVQLTQRSKLALSAYGKTCMKSFEDAESGLRSLDETRDDLIDHR
jgi:hypothetical protein